MWIITALANSVDENTGCQMLTMYDKEVEWVQFHHEESICIHAVSKSVLRMRDIAMLVIAQARPHML